MIALLPDAPRMYGHYGVRFLPRELTNYEALQATLNSYLAHFYHADSHRLIGSLRRRVAPLAPVLSLDKKYVKIPRVLTRFRYMGRQLAFFRFHYPHRLLVVEVGRFWYLMGDEGENVAKAFSLKPIRRSGHILYGFPEKKHRFAKNWFSFVMRYSTSQGIATVVIRQAEQETEYVKLRLPVVHRNLVKPLQLELFKNLAPVGRDKKGVNHEHKR